MQNAETAARRSAPWLSTAFCAAVLAVVIAVPASAAVGLVSRGRAATQVRAPAGRAMAYVSHARSDTITPVDLPAGPAGKPVRMPKWPAAMAVGPDSRVVWVVSEAGRHGWVTPIRAGARAPGKPIGVGNFPQDIAITPDGSTAWVLGDTTLTPVSTAARRAGRPIVLSRNPNLLAERLVLSPDGRMAYVATPFSVIPVNLAARRVLAPIRLHNQSWVFSVIAITPDGTTVYDDTGTSDPVTAISTATRRVLPPLQAGVAPDPIAITSDSRMAYIGSATPGPRHVVSSVYPVATGTSTLGRPILLPGSRSGVNALAITPDGNTIFASTGAGIYTINAATRRVSRPIKVAPPGYVPLLLTIDPNRTTIWALSGSYQTGKEVLTPISITTSRPGRPILHLGSSPGCLLLIPARRQHAARHSQCPGL